MSIHRSTSLVAIVFGALALSCVSGGGSGTGTTNTNSSSSTTNTNSSSSTTNTNSSSSESSSTFSGSAPDFMLEDLEGDEFHLAEHLGDEVILLNFWATWCEPCRIEMPHLNRLQQELGDQGLRIVAISMDGPESVSRVRGHVNRYDYDLTVLIDRDSEVTQQYNPRRGAPFNVLIDRSGSIVWSHEGYAPGDEEELEAQIREALDTEHP